jgi:hypothetical protein
LCIERPHRPPRHKETIAVTAADDTTLDIPPVAAPKATKPVRKAASAAKGKGRAVKPSTARASAKASQRAALAKRQAAWPLEET